METVNRILQEKITARIAPNKAVLIFGARRVGKTVMMRKIVDNYSGRTMMLNGEDYDTLALWRIAQLPIIDICWMVLICWLLMRHRTYHKSVVF